MTNSKWMLKVQVACIGLLTLVLVFPAFADHKNNPADKDKLGDGLSVMVLGSGGPVATPAGRASASYMIFVDGKPRILMDVGGGSYKSLAQAGINLKDLDVVLLSHLHIDHTGDLSSMIKTAYFHAVGAGETRTASDVIDIWGPASSFTGMPSVTDYVAARYAGPDGIERYLNGFAPTIGAGVFSYAGHDLPSKWQTDTTVQDVFTADDGLSVKAIAVKHGPVPAVAYRIEYDGKSIVYSGDTNSESQNMVTIAQGADLLIYDTAIMDTHPNPAMLQLHTTPSRMGEVAAAAMVKKLVLSHITPNTEDNLKEVKRLVRAQGYRGKIKAARDLRIFNLGDK